MVGPYDGEKGTGTEPQDRVDDIDEFLGQCKSALTGLRAASATVGRRPNGRSQQMRITRGAPPPMTETYDVVVVGAGSAGVSAAYQLRDRNVLLLEAGEHLGARSHHEEFEGYRITVGAEDWADADPNSFERGLIEELGVPMANVHGTGGVIWKSLIRAESCDELAEKLPISDEAKKNFTEVYAKINEAITKVWSEGGADYARELVKVRASDWLGDVHPEVLQYYRRIYDSEFSLLPEHVSAFYFLNFMLPYGGAGFDSWDEYHSPTAGMPEVLEAMAAKLPNPPVLGAHVIDVTQDADGAVVTALSTEGELIVRATKVVVATPPAVAARIVSDLPTWKLEVLRDLRSEPVIEMHVLVEDSGPMQWDDLVSAWSVDTAFGLVVPSQTDRAQRIDPAAGLKTSIIKLLSFGAPAEPMIDRTDEQIATAYLRDFYRVFPEARGKVRAHRVDRWVSGATYPRFGYESTVPALIHPVGNVHFAGDWAGFGVDDTTGGFGTADFSAMIGVHTAMRSGTRVAREINAALQ
ncbi:flavin monoamine oxidase family protein [Rhodococcus koreensis]|uniref:flavin monoamine oxidase family protein n=1 Tax=Rhodococcus koreensis TaxID=99653 RepID=UPI00366D85C4